MNTQSCKTPRWLQLRAKLNNLSASAFLQQINSVENPIIIDVRTEEEFSTGHIPNAINIDYFAADFWEQIETLDPSQKIFVYCRTERRSIRTCTLMRNGGFDNSRIFNLEGGYTGLLPEDKTR